MSKETTITYLLRGGPLDGATLTKDLYWGGTAQIRCSEQHGRYVRTDEHYCIREAKGRQKALDGVIAEWRNH